MKFQISIKLFLGVLACLLFPSAQSATVDKCSTANISALKSRVAALKQKLSVSPSFTAQIGNDDTKLQKDGTIIFSYFRANHRTDYDVKTGIFTAPIDGLYVFHLTIKLWTASCSDCSSEIGIVAKGKVISKIKNKGGNTSSVSAAVTLKKGEQAKIKTLSHDRGSLSKFSFLTGYLASPM